MKKTLLIFTVVLLLFNVSTINADQISATDENIISEYEGYVTYSEYDEDNNLVFITTYEDEEIYRFSHINNEIYLITDNEYILAATVEKTPIIYDLVELVQNTEMFRAPSSFVLTNTSYAIGITINASIIDLGKTAIYSALNSVISSVLNMEAITFTSVSLDVMWDLAVYIYENHETYDTSVIRKSYVYSGCTWLIYGELIYPSGHEVGAYTWLDNPSLGVAPYVCKMASLTYPY